MKQSTRRFAEDTKVPPAKSRMEIEDVLRKAGAYDIGTVDREVEGVVFFGLAGRFYRISWPKPPKKAADFAQQERQRWRALLLFVKGAIEASHSGLPLERTLLAHLLLPSGQTVGEYVAPGIEAAYQDGRTPTFQRLLGGPDEGNP